MKQFDLSVHDVTIIDAQNSLGFLEAVFECTEQNRVFAIHKQQVDLTAHFAGTRRVELPEPAETGWGQLRYQPNSSQSLAQISFTSGTTGAPKAILLSHANFGDVVTRLNKVMGLTEEVREYIGVPVTFSFGLARARAVSAVGGQFYLPPRFDLSELARMLKTGEVNAISAVPSLWRIVLANPGVIGPAGEVVRWIEIGSQYMSGAEKAEMRTLFPNACIVQHYGLTEASRSTFLVISDADEDKLETVGVATGEVDLRITDEGAIAIRGPHVARWRLDLETGAQYALTDENAWLITRDMGGVNDGYVTYYGRLDDQLNVSGIKLGAESLEQQIAAHVPQLSGHFAIGKRSDLLRGDRIILASEAGPVQTPLLSAAAELALRANGLDASGSLDILELDSLPRTGTNKIQRTRLADLWGDLDTEQSKRIGAAAVEPADGTADLTATEAKIASYWTAYTPKVGTIIAHNSFYDLGGDSLSSIQVGLEMEKHDCRPVAVRATLEGRPLREVAALEDGLDANYTPTDLTDQTSRTWAVNVVRGVMVLSVLLSHWGDGLFGRMGLEEKADQLLGWIYRWGTPGFALVFGLGLGAFLLPRFPSQRNAVLSRMTSSAKLVALGLSVMAGVILLVRFQKGVPIDGQQVAFAFYNVLCYYLLALLTAPIWLPLLARLPAKPLTFAALAFLFWLGWQAAGVLITKTPQSSLLELVRLMSGAGGYNVFKMTMFVCMGAAVGTWIAYAEDLTDLRRQLLCVGALGCAIFSAALFETYGNTALSGRKNPAYMSVSGILLYGSLVMVLAGLSLSVMSRWTTLSAPLQMPFRILIVIGGLALPIFVFHGLVIPAKDLLELSLGLPASIAVSLPMAAFLLAMGYRGFRLYGMYFRSGLDPVRKRLP